MPSALQYYWVIPGRFAAGEYPGSMRKDDAASKVAQLIAARIDYFIDLTEEDELDPYAHFLESDGGSAAGAVASNRMTVRREHLRKSICDAAVPTREEMIDILNAIDDALAAGRNLYLHCWGGIGRTGTVVGCWLVRRGYSGPDALARVAALFAALPKSAVRKSPETVAQCAFVRDWREILGGGAEEPLPGPLV